MSDDKRDTQKAASPADDCPLSAGQQLRNVILFSLNTGMIYLAAPVLYVGITQAALCQKLEADVRVANLPTMLYNLTTPLAIPFAWYFCAVRMLRPVLVIGYSIYAATGALVVVTLLLPTPAWLVPGLEALIRWTGVRSPADWVILAICLHATIQGCTNGVVNTFSWEVLGRGVAPSRRGLAFSLAYGVGPIMAVIGSLGSQTILGGMKLDLKFVQIDIASPAYPNNFALLFGLSVPIMALAAILSWGFVIPHPEREVERPPFFSGIFGGLGEYLTNRTILLAAIAFVLISSGYSIINNLSLYMKASTGELSEGLAGYQNALRFGFKVFAGLFLGWWLARSNPRSPLLITGAFCIASVVWALTVPGPWYLVTFGLMGAGELMGLYYPNYIFSCSAKSRMRRNMSYTIMLNLFIGFAPYLYGSITDLAVSRGAGEKRGFEYGFYVSIALSAAALLVVLVLPTNPQPRPSDMDESDKVA